MMPKVYLVIELISEPMDGFGEAIELFGAYVKGDNIILLSSKTHGWLRVKVLAHELAHGLIGLLTREHENVFNIVLDHGIKMGLWYWRYG